MGQCDGRIPRICRSTRQSAEALEALFRLMGVWELVFDPGGTIAH
jgi:hypothetical protein